MGLMEFTTIVGVDEKYVKELGVVWKNWALYRSEITTNPIVFVCDGDAGDYSSWKSTIGKIVGDTEFRIELWSQPEVSQREKMLNGLSIVPSYAIDTEWFLKVDCDAFAVSHEQNWFKDDWFSGSPCFVSSGWGYTKPARMLWECEQWSLGVPWLKHRAPVVSEWGDLDSIVKHKRIISYVYFGNTIWHRWATGFLSISGTDKLPCPSQDTFFSWLAVKTGSYYKAVNMKRVGWRHSHRGVHKIDSLGVYCG